MSDTGPALNPNDPREDPLPPIGTNVLVQAEGFRCLAYRDRQGRWRDAFHQNELPGTIRVIESG
jgi:hypothetical protein